MPSPFHVRPAVIDDVPAITEIYAHHVQHGTASFETEAPDAADMTRRWMEVRRRGLPYYLAEQDGTVVAFAYAAPYRTRPAYRFTVEDSIYVRPDWTGRGIGHSLLGTVIDRCERLGLRQMVAIIGDSENHASIRLHESHAFEFVGVLQGVGYKFDRWLDTVIMQRTLVSPRRRAHQASNEAEAGPAGLADRRIPPATGSDG